MTVKRFNRPASIAATALFLIVVNATASTTIYKVNGEGALGHISSESSPLSPKTGDMVNVSFTVADPAGLAPSMTWQPAKWSLLLIGSGMVALGLAGRKNKKKPNPSVIVSADVSSAVPLTPEQLFLGVALVTP